MATVHVYLIAGTMKRVVDGWCADCQVSSFFTGPVWRLSPSGVCLYGQITGCLDCQSWITKPCH